MKTTLDEFMENFRQQPSTRAVIREEACIGCFKCVQACPFDAIVGTPKKLCTVIEWQCIGCQQCLEPCPVDCIDMVTVERSAATQQQLEESAITQFHLKQTRIKDYAEQQDTQYQWAKNAFQASADWDDVQAARRAQIAAAVERVVQPPPKDEG